MYDMLKNILFASKIDKNKRLHIYNIVDTKYTIKEFVLELCITINGLMIKSISRVMNY